MRNWRLRRGITALALALLALPAVPGTALAEPTYPFRDPHLPVNVRVDDLLGRLTQDEKISWLHQYQPAIPRLGIGLFKTGTEALHGVAWSTDIDNNGAVVKARGTVFPQPVGMASTWNTDLIRQVGSAVGDEARGYHAQNPRVWGLNLWAPVVNLLRDPRWGRNEEGYSEDPLLTAEISTAYGSGMTGGDPNHLKSAPTLKHYLAYNNEVRRDVTSSNVPPRVLNEYDRAAFKPAIAADAATGMMAAYNLVNGRPATVDPDLATVVRDWTDQPLMNVTDAWAPNNLVASQGYYPTQAEGNAAIIKAGLNSFITDDTNAQPTITAIKQALATGLLTEADIDARIREILNVRFRLGEFDPGGGRYGGITPDVINSPEHQRLARQAAGEAMVLLKNERQALPLNPARTRKVAVLGPLADTLYSDWYGGDLPYQVTALDGIRERLGSSASVSGLDGADRIALKDVSTGRYVSATGTTDADRVLGTGATPALVAQFDVVDWGQDVVTLRNAANGRYLGYNWGPFLTRDEQPNGWYVQQQFKLEPQADGTVVLRYVGYETKESWFGADTYVTIGDDGALKLGASTPTAATHFSRELISNGIHRAVAAAKAADTAVLVVGSNPFINGREAHDRTSTALSAGQEALVKAVARANPRTVLVLQTSYPVTIRWEQEHVPAIVWTTHAGAETGHAVADVLFGDRNPSGRLTQTWYRSDSQLPPDLLEYDIISSGQTYLYSRAKPLYPFGHGLSYTRFRYGQLRAGAQSVAADGTITASVDVTNVGSRTGTEVVQLYTHQRTSRDTTPIRQLKAFQQVKLAPGQTRTVTLRLPAADLAHWDVTRSKWVVESSVHDLMVGASVEDIRARAAVRVRGETIPARDLSRPTRAENFDRYAGARLVDETKPSGTAVGATAAGQWISFDGSALRADARTFTAKVAKAGAGVGTIQIRLGSPTGRLLGTATVPSTGDDYRYVSTSTELARAVGTHDVYLVFDSPLRLAEFSIR
ncbi:glycoside hydrolase family 3 C-terminal domain-containing protein [Micromonospora sp. NBC_00362]|uniref:glycoside hydrolase family 3 protein n=1 Tax=Micromonospora sp. NBC_00362 TaxID=2975975 RepID=UPI00225A03A8|nr:glycoside hydrolase family 3 protein [Micromonospora sp. NBC_00362]MCX5118433.1 glycoside hydrolase family 3 C-terminal domain-containing protein [Micromonospora sp. NBC_00362]